MNYLKIKKNIDSILDLDGFQSIIIAKNNKIIYKYGNIKYNGYLASCRKSILAILFGLYSIDINKTLGELGINDKLGLSKSELTANIKHLLTGRSGIYHPSSNDDNENKPQRYCKKPGEYFYYNNWDFNALKTIFEKETNINIYDALNDLGKKIGFKDFNLDYNKKKYNERKIKIKKFTKSVHLPYPMYLSARDMLKIGYLMLNKGKYKDKQIIPKEWIEDMIKLHTKKEEQNELKLGYGYMWWIFDENNNHPLYKGYMARGDNGQSIIVIPKFNMVIITKYYLFGINLLEKIFNIKL
jgi:hypothetical protein